jgi:hypothetical protein
MCTRATYGARTDDTLFKCLQTIIQLYVFKPYIMLCNTHFLVLFLLAQCLLLLGKVHLPPHVVLSRRTTYGMRQHISIKLILM